MFVIFYARFRLHEVRHDFTFRTMLYPKKLARWKNRNWTNRRRKKLVVIEQCYYHSKPERGVRWQMQKLRSSLWKNREEFNLRLLESGDGLQPCSCTHFFHDCNFFMNGNWQIFRYCNWDAWHSPEIDGRERSRRCREYDFSGCNYWQATRFSIDRSCRILGNTEMVSVD